MPLKDGQRANFDERRTALDVLPETLSSVGGLAAVIRVVMSAHGIRTRGVWQKDLAPTLALNGFVPYPLDYGNFSIFSFALPSARTSKVEWLQREYERVVAEANVRRPSIVAHSLGTYLVTKLLLKYPEIRFDKVILAGSIVKPDFDWPTVGGRGQVNLVRNDFGSVDVWPKLARLLIRDAGPSGTTGFTTTSPFLTQEKFAHHGHGDYFHRTHFTNFWIPTLRRVVVSQSDRTQFVEVLDMETQAVAERLKIKHDLLRANIFVPDEPGRLRIPQGLHYNMRNEEELSLSIQVGMGCTGAAFQERRPTVAIFRESWGPHTLPESELRKANPALRWIISTPIPDPDPDTAGAVIGVFNVDCLEERREREDLEPLFQDLSLVAQALALRFRDHNRR